VKATSVHFGILAVSAAKQQILFCYFQKISVILFGMFSNPGTLLEGESLLKINFF